MNHEYAFSQRSLFSVGAHFSPPSITSVGNMKDSSSPVSYGVECSFYKVKTSGNFLGYNPKSWS